MPRGPVKATNSRATEDTATSESGRRRADKVQEEEEVKLSAEEIYELELAEAREKQKREDEEKRAMLLAKQRQGLEVCMEDINFLKQDYNAALESKNIT